MAKNRICRGMIFGLYVAISSLLTTHMFAQSEFSIEYFIDADKGVGKNSLVETSRDETTLQISLSGVATGVHTISFRASDQFGNWSTTITHPLYICEASRFAGLGYFIDSDPGEGNGIGISQNMQNVFDIHIATSSLTAGAHTFNMRGLNSNGTWTSITTCPFIVLADTLILEWWYDTDPGIGNANQLCAESGDNFLVLPTSDLSSGVHLLSFRCKDRNGNWSVTSTLPLYVTEFMSSFEAAEYFIDEDPGVGFGNSVVLSSHSETAFTVPTEDLQLGNHTLNFRCRLENGEWLPIYASPFVVTELGGVKDVCFSNQFLFSRNADGVLVTGIESKGIQSIEVYTISGIKLFSSSWNDMPSSHFIHIPEEFNPIIVKVADSEGNIHIRKLLL